MNISVKYRVGRDLVEKSNGGHPAPDAVCFVRRSSGEVIVGFVFTDCARQDGGSISVSPDVARWLAGALLAAADGHTKTFPISATIEDDAIKRSA